jgi:hypothetical protein
MLACTSPLSSKTKSVQAFAELSQNFSGNSGIIAGCLYPFDRLLKLLEQK